MPVPPPAVMVEPAPAKRSGFRAEPALDLAQIERRVSLGLRTRSPVGSAWNLPSEPRKETYTWGGYRYEIDQDTRPEWINAENNKVRGETKTLTDDERSASLASTTSSVTSAFIAQMIDATKLIVKLPVSVNGETMPTSRHLTSPSTQGFPCAIDEEASSAMDIDSDLSPPARFSPNGELERHIAALTIFHSPIELRLEPPYVQEPDLRFVFRVPGVSEDFVEEHQKSVLQAYYGENTFECPFHTTITKFLRYMDIDSLKSLKPGSVRLTNRLAHMGFVYRALQDFNHRSLDGLQPDVVLVPIKIKGQEQDVWISWADVDEYDGVRGGWRAGEDNVSRRKRKQPACMMLDSDDDDL